MRAQDAQRGLHLLVLPVPDDDLAVQAQAAADKAKLAVAMGRLVEVHKVHIDVGPGDVAVVLGVQMRKRLLERAQAGDPHLGRREGVHPGDQADALLGGVGLQHQLVDRPGVVSTDLNTTLTEIAAASSSAFGNHPRVLGDMLERLGAIQVLAAGDKPEFERLRSIIELRYSYKSVISNCHFSMVDRQDTIAFQRVHNQLAL